MFARPTAGLFYLLFFYFAHFLSLAKFSFLLDFEFREGSCGASFYCVALFLKSSYFLRINIHSYMVLRSGGGKKGVAIRPYPAPGPPPFNPNAFLMCETLTGFDSYWASSLKINDVSDRLLSFIKKVSLPNSKYFFCDAAQYKSNADRHYNYTSVSKRLRLLEMV